MKLTKPIMLLFLLLNTAFIFSDVNGELLIKNVSGSEIRVSVYPIGTIYNGVNSHQYIFTAAADEELDICGGEGDVPNNETFYIAFDGLGFSDVDAVIGHGRYRVTFSEISGDIYVPVNYVDVDFSDYDYPDSYTVSFSQDLEILYYNSTTIKYEFREEIPIPQNRLIQVWDQRSPNFPNLMKTQDKGNFLSVPSSNSNPDWRNWPINATNHGGLYHLNPGSIFTNLSIQSNVTVNLIGNNTMVVEQGSVLTLLQNSTLNVNSGCTLYVKKNGKICKFGGTITGTVTYEKGIHSVCDRYDGIMEDSVRLILEDSAIVEFPDSTILQLEGPATKLIMGNYSELRFGKNSKLILKDGASIYANGSKFTSMHQDSVWDGIYLSDLSCDTIKNCTIENAYNGINIDDKVTAGIMDPPPAVEISNCTFKNTTSVNLLNYVYINNSTNVLIKSCASAKTGSGAFVAGIVAEYCPSNGTVITDNTINYVTTGISLLQSSEYVARNTITGSTNSGTGIYLDNSNGTIEYNIVNNFQKSVYGSYSSPYMLKNTLSGASSKGIELVSSSFPVMKPVVSGGTSVRWLGGNNTVTGTPSHSGINFTDCYPLMDSGYNRIIVNGADYMNGTFTSVNTTVYARINYWYDSPPNSSLFDITFGSVVYTNPFDGSSLPSTDGSELNSIGWGMYDTVFTLYIGDSPEEDLFMQAYSYEMSGEYEDAIDNYQDVLSSYKTSAYAPVSLSRIFNCLEKAGSNSSDYETIQSYYSSVNENGTHPLGSRELAEDFVIKSKVKRGLLEDAIDDYNTIYVNNMNNSKGQHALLNKLCLASMSSGGDNPYGENENHKLAVLSLITGEQINTKNVTYNTTPSRFRLSQNYPNPFNPVTMIKYEIPKDAFITIKVYDILGREVFSHNEFKTSGSYEVRFDGTGFASGMYFYSLEAGTFKETKKMVLIK